MSERTVAFVKDLVQRFPGLSTQLEEHLQDHFGETLPHLFFGELTRYVLALLTNRSSDELLPRRELRQILDFLEQEFERGEPELQELIAVSFLENLPYPGEDGSQLRSMLGKALSEQLDRMG